MENNYDGPCYWKTKNSNAKKVKYNSLFKDTNSYVIKKKYKLNVEKLKVQEYAENVAF